ncbi:MAG: RibD family protein [Fimbriimonas sp.]|nr:RibD family protein [Fimbriimonas sp.]
MNAERADGTHVYSDLAPAEVPLDRPYAFINMVSTIDGKILSGSRSDDVLDLGSKTDHLLMRRIAETADAVMIGAQTLRTAPKAWNPNPRIRIVVSASGSIPYDSRFLSDGEAYVVGPSNLQGVVRPPVRLLGSEAASVDFPAAFARLRAQLGIRRLLVLGGSELNAQLLAANLIDELFLTVAPKVKLGRDVPTYADGEPLAREDLQQYILVEHHAIGNEIFIRYRRDIRNGQP